MKAVKDIKIKEQLDINIKAPIFIESPNAITGDKNFLYYSLKESIKKAEAIDIIVSFLMESGVKLILEDLKEAVSRGVKIRILTGNYLRITEPSALYLLKGELGDKIDLRFYNVPSKSFHPKSYIFHNQEDSEIYLGSSNLSRGALTASIEWNYRFLKSQNPKDFNVFYKTFEDLFYNHSQVIDEEVMKEYSRTWKRPKVYKDLEEEEAFKENKLLELFEPRGAQLEALYALENCRKEGYDKALVVAATGVGKTYLAAFDSRKYNRILFVAHREEIIKQAAESFKNVRKSQDIGFFYSDTKDKYKSMIFALVQTLGKAEYLKESYFSRDYFDYIIIDEFHHAVSKNYRNIIEYFRPKFLLGLTATPERLDSKDVFALCDYNTVYEVRLTDAINKGYLVPFRYYGIYDETVNYDNVEYKNGKYNDKDLEKSLMINKRAELILNHYKKYSSKRALGFCSSKNHAEYMAEYFCKNGVGAAAVYSGEKGKYSENRTDAINKLTKGELKVIFSVDMFNEGLDIPSIDMVMFLRPTESPTVFLQQLGRGLRKYKDKKYLNALDFIGNYKKADLLPFLLSGKEYSSKEAKRGSFREEDYPEDCLVEFDFRLIDLFKRLASKERQTKEKIKEALREEYLRIKEELAYRPSRLDFFRNLDDEIYSIVKSKADLNPFNNYLKFLKENNELTKEEEGLYNTRGREFINMIETTSMSKSYKMPIFLAFYNKGKPKMEIDEEEVYQSFYEFYHKGSNKVDMLRHKSTADFESWDRKRYIKLAKDNPIKFLLDTHGDFFKIKEGALIALQDDMKDIIKDKAFIEHMKDAIDLRIDKYYKERKL